MLLTTQFCVLPKFDPLSPAGRNSLTYKFVEGKVAAFFIALQSFAGH